MHGIKVRISCLALLLSALALNDQFYKRLCCDLPSCIYVLYALRYFYISKVNNIMKATLVKYLIKFMILSYGKWRPFCLGVDELRDISNDLIQTQYLASHDLWVPMLQHCILNAGKNSAFINDRYWSYADMDTLVYDKNVTRKRLCDG